MKNFKIQGLDGPESVISLQANQQICYLEQTTTTEYLAPSRQVEQDNTTTQLEVFGLMSLGFVAFAGVAVVIKRSRLFQDPSA